VASYNNNEDAPHEPDGVALVWNLKYKKDTPEYIFHCQVRTSFNCNCVTNMALGQYLSESLHGTSSWPRGYSAMLHYCNTTMSQFEL